MGMLGYHDNDRCGFDLWSPVEEKQVCEITEDSYYSQLYHREPHCAIENRAFSPYAVHTQEMEDIIQSAVDEIHAAGIYDEELTYNLTIDGIMNDYSQSDIEYIKSEIVKRL